MATISFKNIKSKNNEYMKARNAANSADVNVMKLNATDQIELASIPYVGANYLLNSSLLGAVSGIATLDGAGKIPASQLTVTAMEYKGAYNATTNSPALIDGTGSTGDVYAVSVAGTQNFGSGAITLAIGDWLIYNGSIWEKVSNTSSVSSVFGRTGAVTAQSGDYTTTLVTEGTNLYFTDARARTAAVSDSITDGITNIAPSQNAVFDALALKQASYVRSQETITLNGTDITNQYKDLAQEALSNSLVVYFNGIKQTLTTDFTLSVVATKTRITFAGDLATAGASELVSGDILTVAYEY